jgi:hypothetical protein
MGKSKDQTHKGISRYFPTYPFKSKLDRADDFLYFTPDHTESEIIRKAGGGIRVPLEEKELELIDHTVKTRNLSDIKCFLIQKCHVQNVADLSWMDILNHLRFWLTERQEKLSKKTGGKAGDEKPAGIEQNIKIQNFTGVLGNVQQAKNLQIGDHASIHKHDSTEEKKKCILRKIPYWIYILTLFFAALLTCLYYLGWLGPIKGFILHK